MADTLFSQYTSGTQFTAGATVGSFTGGSGINAIVDRLNAIVIGSSLRDSGDLLGSSLIFQGNVLFNSVLLTGNLIGAEPTSQAPLDLSRSLEEDSEFGKFEIGFDGLTIAADDKTSTTSQTTTSTTAVKYTNGSILVGARKSNADFLVSMSANLANVTGDKLSYARIYRSGASNGSNYSLTYKSYTPAGASNVGGTVATTWLDTAAAGSRVYGVEFYSEAGGSAVIDDVNINAVQLEY